MAQGKASPGSVAPDETGDGIAGAEPLKIELAIGKGKALMRCLSWRMTALRTGVPRKSAVF